MALPRTPRATLGRARRLRKEMTDAERTLWSALRRNALDVRFRREHPVGPYIADFACHPLRLAVEVDGSAHAGLVARAHDADRDAYFAREGWRVLRLPNEVVERRFEDAVEAIRSAIKEAQLERQLRRQHTDR